MPSQQEIRKQITDKIIEGLEKGMRPWVRPWNSDLNSGFPASIETKNSYRGINPLVLSLTADVRGYTSRWWGTYQQWRSLGGQVKRRPKEIQSGEWGTTIVFYIPVKKMKVDRNGQEKVETISVLRTSTVFNLAEVEGNFAHLQPDSSDVDAVEPNYRRAEETVKATGAVIKYGGNKAFYRRPIGAWPNHTGGDFIQVPKRTQFSEMKEYYATVFHELCHWSEVRLHWKGSYALGELIAEIGACYLASSCQIPGSDCLENHSKYVKAWLKELQDDHSAIFRAAAQASRAADFVMSFSGTLIGSAGRVT